MISITRGEPLCQCGDCVACEFAAAREAHRRRPQVWICTAVPCRCALSDDECNCREKSGRCRDCGEALHTIDRED
jgi:hypothetical protein